MKPITTYALAFFLLLTLVFTASFAPTTAKADDEPKPVSGTADSVITGPDSASGTSEFTVGNQAYTSTFSLTYAILPPDTDGTIRTVSSHIFTVFRDGIELGTFTTSDNGVLTPTTTPGVMNLDNTLNIVSGTGKFVNTRGTLYTVNKLNFLTNPPSAKSVITGSVYRVED